LLTTNFNLFAARSPALPYYIVVSCILYHVLMANTFVSL
jgi:hypothetical protein